MATSPGRIRRWKRVEYDRLIDLGAFKPGEHLELLGGHLIVSEPQGTLHTTAVGLVHDALRLCFGAGWLIRCQMPIALDDESEPEPDVAVVPGTWTDYAVAHPALAALVVEIAETSLREDRRRKATLYARGAVADYWILNLVDRVLEVCRDPITAAMQRSGWRYREVTIVQPDASVAPLARPDHPIAVADLLPPANPYLR